MENHRSTGILSRRQLMGGLAALPILGTVSASAAPPPDDVVAIIDTPDNAARHVAKLKDQKVKIVARYYARRAQPNSLPEKRLVDNSVEGVPEARVLTQNGISILSVYQYQNQNPQKFLTGLSDTGSPEAEANADADAALSQANTVNQPRGSAIYFGLDFNLTRHKYDENGVVRGSDRRPVPNTVLIDACMKYFEIINRRLGGQYQIGVYGNGFANAELRRRGLVKYSWISASRAFEDTSAFYNSGEWHLFQNQVDRRWFQTGQSCRSGLDIDTDIQNPAKSEIGAWGAGEVPAARTQKILDQRRFVRQKMKVYQAKSTSSGLIGRQVCRFIDRAWRYVPENTVERNMNVRVIADDGTWVHIDLDDDGLPDGYCLKTELTANLTTMPPWDRSSQPVGPVS